MEGWNPNLKSPGQFRLQAIDSVGFRASCCVIIKFCTNGENDYG